MILGDGFWLNFKTDEYFVVDEHETWLRYNYSKLNVDFTDLEKFKPVEEKQDCFKYILKKYPLVRIRRHGIYITFEFCIENDLDIVINAIYKFLNQINICGDYTGLNIININKFEKYILWKDFKTNLLNKEY